MTNEEFARSHVEWERRIRSLARRLSRGDYDLAQDLEQTGRCVLWRMDVMSVTGDAVRYIRRTLRNGMLNVVRKERRARIITPKWQSMRDLEGCTDKSVPLRLESRYIRKRTLPRHHGAAPDPVEGDVIPIRSVA